MNIIFLMIAFPEGNSKGMYNELVEEFAKNGKNVYVIAPAINSFGVSKENNISVLRVKTMPLFDINPIKKGIANLLLPSQYKSAIKKYFPLVKFDLVILPTPPITFVDTLKFLKKRNKCKSYLILRDIFPQNAVDLGLIRNKFIISFFRRKERKLYDLIDSIGCMSQGNIDYILRHNPEIDKRKLHILENWLNVPEFIEPDYSIKKRLGLEGKFVALFGGNLGIPQKVDFILDAAERIAGNQNIVFLIIGKGTEKPKIQQNIAKRMLKNVILMNHIPRDEFLALSKSCNVGLVNLSEKFSIPNIPSRTLSYWALKLPVLAAIDKHTDFGEYIDKIGGGLWSYTGDVDSYLKHLLFLYENPNEAQKLGMNGYNYLILNLNSKKSFEIVMEHI